MGIQGHVSYKTSVSIQRPRLLFPLVRLGAFIYIMAEEEDSRTSTPRSFAGQTVSAEEMLKEQTVGLVHLSDFRKRRAEVLEQKEREAHDKSLGRLASGNSRSATPSTGEVTDG